MTAQNDNDIVNKYAAAGEYMTRSISADRVHNEDHIAEAMLSIFIYARSLAMNPADICEKAKVDAQHHCECVDVILSEADREIARDLATSKFGAIALLKHMRRGTPAERIAALMLMAASVD